MVMSEEKLKILQMLQNGVITADQAAGLLEAMGEEKVSPAKEQVFSGETSSSGKRWFRVRVTDSDTGKTRVNVRMPLGIVDAGLKMGKMFVPEIDGMDIKELMGMIGSGAQGKLVDVFDDEDGEHVEVFIE